MDEIQELKKLFIKDAEFGLKALLPEYVKRSAKYCAVTSSGGIHFIRADLSQADMIQLAAMARLLANHLEPEIKERISVGELATYATITSEQASARAGELEGKTLIKVSRGLFKFNPLKIGGFLDSIEKKYGGSDD